MKLIEVRRRQGRPGLRNVGLEVSTAGVVPPMGNNTITAQLITARAFARPAVSTGGCLRTVVKCQEVRGERGIQFLGKVVRMQGLDELFFFFKGS